MTDRRTMVDSKDRVYAQRRAVKTDTIAVNLPRIASEAVNVYALRVYNQRLLIIV